MERTVSVRLTHLQKSGNDKVTVHVLPVATVYEHEYRKEQTLHTTVPAIKHTSEYTAT